MRTVLSILSTLMLMIISSCNNPKGGSIVSGNHTPFLDVPGGFNFSKIDATDTQVVLRWGKSSRAESYTVFWGTSLAVLDQATCTGTLTSCTITGLTNNSTYYFSVTATNPTGTRNITAAKSGRPIGSFSVSSAVAGDASSQLTWSSAVGATAYTVKYGTSPGNYNLTATTTASSPYTVTGLENGVQYYFKVTATNADSGLFAADEVSTTPFGPPTAPAGLAANGQPGQINLSWTSVAGADSYKVYRGTTSGSYSLVASSIVGTSYVDGNVVDGTSYFYVVRGFNGFDSSNSNEAAARTITAFSMTSMGPTSANSLSVSWNATAGAAAYDIIYGTVSGTYTSTLSNVTSPATLTGLSGGVTYYARVVARNSVGTGTQLNSTNELSATAVGSVAAPSGVAVVANPAQAIISWNAVPGASSYIVRRGIVSGTHTDLATGVGTLNYTDGTAANGTTYFYTVRAFNGLTSTDSAEVSIRPIASFTATSALADSSSQITVNWPAVTGAAAFDLQYGTTSGNYNTTLSNVTSPRVITGLAANTTYYFRVVAKNAVGLGTTLNATNELSAKTATSAPTGLLASATSGQIQLAWVNTPGAVNYEILRGTVSGTYSSIATSVGTNSYTDSTVTNGTTYYYVVRASNGVDSANSNESSARAIAAFNIASVVPGSSSSVVVSWPAVSGAASFDVRYGTVAGSYTNTITGATSPRTVTGLSPNTTYYFMVVAKNAIGGAATVNATAELSATTPFGAPTGLVAIGESGQNYLAWDPIAGASSYHILRGTVSGTYSSLVTGVTVANYTDTTAADGTSYFYVVRANNGTDSGNSNESSARPIAAFLANAPSAITATGMSVSWASATGAATYDLRYGTTSGTYTNTLTGVTSPRAVTGLSGNTTYFFQVVAKNAVGGGAIVNATSEVSGTTAVSAPSGLVATATTGQISLSWNAVAGATSYHVLRGTASGATSSLASGITATSYVDTTATDGTTYFYVVRANNGTDSTDSSEVSGRPISTFNISNAVADSSSQITLSWPAVAGAVTYDVKYGTSSGIYNTTLAGATTPRVITGLTSNTTYYFQVVAKNAIGSGNSVNANSEASATTSFGAPSGLVAIAPSTSQINLNWSVVPGAATYHVLRGTSTGSYTSLATGVTSNAYNDTTATNGTTYYYVVRASNGTDSANSNESSARPIATFAQNTPTTVTNSSLSLSWAAATGAATFDLKYGTTSGTYTNTLTGVTSPYSLTSLTANTTYYFQVVAKNAIGGGATLNSTAEVSATTALGAPSGFTAAAGSGSIGLSWNSVAGASSYHLLRGTSSGTYSSLVTGLGVTSYVDTTAVDGTTYFYVVRANNGVDSANSSEVSGRGIAAFAMISVTPVSSSAVNIAWPVVNGASSYDLKYGTASGTYTTTVTGATSTYSLTGLTPATTYYFMVTAKNSVGAGNSVNATTELSSTTSYGAPSGLVATASTSQIQLNWSAVAGAANYHVLRGTSSGSYSSLQTGVATNSYVDTSAVNGTTYYYVVRANNGTDSADSNEVSGRAIAAFTISSATQTSTTSIDVAWVAATGAASYDVKYGTSSGSYTTTLTNQTSPTSISGLTSGQTYYFMVTAKNAVGSGNSVNATLEATATTPLSAATGLVATATTSQAQLSWTTVAGATSYNVYRGTVSGSYALLTAGNASTSYTDTTPSNGTTYFYVVRAVKSSVESANSNEASARPIANFTIVSAVANSASQIALTWNAASGAASYDVKYGTVSGTYGVTLTNQTSPLAITGLASGQTYYFMVTAKNAIGGGATLNASAEVNTKTAVGAPTGLVATTTSGQVQLNWTTVSGATSYHVLRGTVSGSYASLATGVATNSYTDTTPTNGTTYYYVVRSNNGADSVNSSEVSGRPIAAFTLASATPTSSTAITLAWNSASGAATYDVRYGPSSGNYTTTLTNQTSPLSVTALSAGQTYYFSVTAKNAVGSGANVVATNELSAATATGAPTGLVAVGASSQNNLTWTTVVGATSYSVYRGTISGTYSSLATGVGTNSYSDTTSVNGTTYFYVVRANNGSESANSNEGSARSIAPFTLITATPASSTSVTLSWNAAAGAASYDVKRGTSTGTYDTTIAGQTSPATLTGLTAGQTYYFRVTARNAVGGSAAVESTNELSAVTALNAPTGVAATATTSQVSLSWNSVVGATSYSVYRGVASGVYSLLTSGLATTTHVDTTISDGTTYYYVIRASNGSESANSLEVSARGIASFTISSVTGTAPTSASVTWAAATGAASYDVKYGTTTGSYGTTLTGQTSPASITGLTAGTTYYFMVTAKNAVGTGASVNASAEFSVTTPLTAPTGLAVVPTTSQAALAWVAVAGATSYNVYRGTVSGTYSSLATGVATTTYTDSTATNGTTYYYVVRAVKTAVESANSNEASGRPIAAFTIASATASSSTSVNVTWTAVTGAATYEVKYGTVSGTYTSTITGATSPTSVTGLTPGQTYYFRVVAKNAIGTGASVNSSNEPSVNLSALPTISNISNLSAESDGSVVVNFTITDSDNSLNCSSSMEKTSTDTALIPTANIVFSGTAPNCSATITPVEASTGASTLTFTVTDGVSNVSDSFVLTITPCVVASINWETQPTGMVAGNLFGASPRVSLRKADNSLCQTNLNPVNIAVGTDGSTQQDATVTATSSVIPSGGYALFNAARMTRAGTGHTLEATQGSITSAESNTFNVTAATASVLAWEVQPPTYDRLTIIQPNPVVRIADTYGNYTNTSGVSITVSLLNNLSGSTLSGTRSRTTSATGAVTYNNLSINNPQTGYYLQATATGYPTVNSTPFDIFDIVPRDTVAILDLLPGNISHPNGAGNTNYRRGFTRLSNVDIDGSTVWTFEIVARNPGTAATSVVLLRGGTTVATISVPAGTVNPTRYTVAITASNVTATRSTFQMRAASGNATITSARVIAAQTGALRSIASIPLAAFSASSLTPYFETTSSTSTALPDNVSVPWVWDTTKLGHVNEVVLMFSHRTQTSNTTCVQLFNRSTNTAIGTEQCNSSTSENVGSQKIITPGVIIPEGALLEARVRSSVNGQWVRVFNVQLFAYLVSIEKMQNIQRLVGDVTAVTAAETNFVEHRAMARNNFGSASVNNYLKCNARATVTGSSNFVVRDNNTNTSGTTSPTDITGSSLTFTTQSAYTLRTAGPFATTTNDNQYVTFNRTSGTFDLAYCFWTTEAVY